ncbi:MAG: septum formation initiator family protein [Actinomycetota bacterium]|nr:septum formation initiator family protein [Actinomycetota bacterium]
MAGPGLTRRSAALAGSATRPLGARIGDFLGITSPRRAAMLAVAVCVLALSVAVPLRNYVSQRSELAAVYEQQLIVADKVAELERRRDLLSDPRHIQAQARERLRYVRPGEAPYVVQLPPGQTAAAAVAGPGSAVAPRELWYGRLWKSINGG